MSYDNSQLRIVEAESYDQRLERMYSYFDHLPRYVHRHVEAGWDPRNNVVAVRTRPEGNYFIKEWFPGANIVTNDGDIYYAKKGAGESPASNENFLQARAQWANPGSQTSVAKTDTWDQFDAPGAISASIKTITSTYPKTNDTGDADNTGDAVDAVSYKYDWTTSDFNDGGTTIKNGALHDNASPVNATKLLTHFQITAFNKTSSDTLKLFVNHTMNGV